MIVQGPLALTYGAGDPYEGETSTELLEVGEYATYSRPHRSLEGWHMLKVFRGGTLYDCAAHSDHFIDAPTARVMIVTDTEAFELTGGELTSYPLLSPESAGDVRFDLLSPQAPDPDAAVDDRDRWDFERLLSQLADVVDGNEF